MLFFLRQPIVQASLLSYSVFSMQGQTWFWFWSNKACVQGQACAPECADCKKDTHSISVKGPLCIGVRAKTADLCGFLKVSPFSLSLQRTDVTLDNSLLTAKLYNNDASRFCWHGGTDLRSSAQDLSGLISRFCRGGLHWSSKQRICQIGCLAIRLWTKNSLGRFWLAIRYMITAMELKNESWQMLE